MKKIIRQIGSIYRSLEFISNKEFKEMSLGNNLYAYLVYIAENPGTISKELAIDLKVDKTTVSRSIKKLENNNLIERRLSETNKKEWHLFATELGLKNYQVILSEYEYSSKKILSGLSDDDIKKLNVILDKVESNASLEWNFVRDGNKREYL